jgi:hypothetical protein
MQVTRCQLRNDGHGGAIPRRLLFARHEARWGTPLLCGPLGTLLSTQTLREVGCLDGSSLWAIDLEAIDQERE